MLINVLRIARLGTRVACVAATMAVIGLAVVPHALGLIDRQMYVVRGSSMQPAIPLGSIILVQRVDPASIAVGDVITFRAPNDAVVTHRVQGVDQGTDLAFRTKGDGSNAADPVVVPAAAVSGRVETYVPGLGYAVTALASLLGALAMLGLIGGLMLMSWFLDELIGVVGTASHRRAVSQPAH